MSKTTPAAVAMMIIFLVSGEMDEPGAGVAFSGSGDKVGEGVGLAPDVETGYSGLIVGSGLEKGGRDRKSVYAEVRTYNPGNSADPHLTLEDTTPTAITSPSAP